MCICETLKKLEAAMRESGVKQGWVAEQLDISATDMCNLLRVVRMDSKQVDAINKVLKRLEWAAK